MRGSLSLVQIMSSDTHLVSVSAACCGKHQSRIRRMVPDDPVVIRSVVVPIDNSFALPRGQLSHDSPAQTCPAERLLSELWIYETQTRSQPGQNLSRNS